MKRGSFAFDVSSSGDLTGGTGNVEALRRLWLDRTLIDGADLGPGDEGDFDHGAWHVACHVIAAGGVRRAAGGGLLWLEVSHDPAKDEYYPSVSGRAAGGVVTARIDSPEGGRMLDGSTLLGFVEGNSVGRISARTATDPNNRFNGWTRQQFNRPVTSADDGGKVWEHWCTVRDIRPSHRIGSSVLEAYVTLVAALGDRFVPTVTRGRRRYGHPAQLCAMVRAGLTAERSATWDASPKAIPAAVERKFLEARPADALEGAEKLTWTDGPRYYMFSRRIRSWSAAGKVRSDLREFGD